MVGGKSPPLGLDREETFRITPRYLWTAGKPKNEKNRSRRSNINATFATASIQAIISRRLSCW